MKKKTCAIIRQGLRVMYPLKKVGLDFRAIN